MNGGPGARRGAGRARPGEPRRGESRRGETRREEPRRGDSRRGSELGGEQIEGRHAVRELLAAGTRRVKVVYLSSTAEPAPILDEIADLAGPALRIVASGKVAAMARSEAHQGIVATAAPLHPADLDELLAVPDAFLVAVDGITDPGNLGAVLRSAAAFGATGVVLPRHRSAHVSPTVAKAAAGAIEHLPIALVSGVPAALERAARAGVWTVGLAGDGATDLGDLTVADAPVMLVLGAEGRGLSRLAEQRCDVIARIPIAPHVESLNAAAAAAVACYEIARRRRDSGR